MGVSQRGWNTARRPPRWRNDGQDPGLKHGFRSGLEKLNADHLAKLGVPIVFEELTIPYTVPETSRKYTPDYLLPNGIIVETKGKFETSDRAKHLLIKIQHPELDIRFVFQRPGDTIYKGSKTTYAQWADKHGFRWATRVIPKAWIEEAGPAKKPRDVLA